MKEKRGLSTGGNLLYPTPLEVSHPSIPLVKNRIFSSVLALSAAFSANCLALTPVSDKFTGPKINETLWYQAKLGSGSLTQNGKLNFVVTAKPAEQDYASIELMPSQPGFNEDWEIVMDVSNTSKMKRKVGIGFMLFNFDDRKDYLYFEFYGKTGLSAGVLQDGVHAPNARLSAKTGPSKGSIRARFSKKTKLVTFWFSQTGAAQGYNWVKVGTFSPKGKGGKINANWKMNPGSGRFGVQLFGFGQGSKVAAKKATVDNFTLKTP